MRHLTKLTLAAGLALAAALVWPQPVQTQSNGRIVRCGNVPGIAQQVCVVAGRFTTNLTLTRDRIWVLRGAVFFGAPSVLTIEPGTLIAGETATRGTLIIERGAQIIANGTAEAPIVMTSDQPIGKRGRGDWGGLVLNGTAPVNLPGGVGIGEGDTGVYGGDNPDDSSGILRFVRVEFAGIEFSPDNEMNGIAFQAVGRGTIVENIQIHFNKDDGVEFFGGTVDVKRVLLTGIGDDSIDWTFGWLGRMQFAIAQQRGDDTDNGIEADNNGNNNDLLPRSAPTIYNMTLVGDPTLDVGPESADGARLREGTAAIIRNAIVVGFKSEAFDVRNDATINQIGLGTLQITHSIAFDNRAFGGGSAAQARNSAAAALWDPPGSLNAAVNPMLVAPYSLTAPDWRPLPGSPALTRPVAGVPNDGFFEPVSFIGALAAALELDWTRGWTTFAQN
jgi:hypothetical protein